MTDAFTPWLVVAAFAGGAFGASIGALASFSMAGAAVVAGEIYQLAATGSDLPGVPFTQAVGFGVVLGPHVAFGGGAAAAAYLGRSSPPDGGRPDFSYHPAKDILSGLGSRWDVLAVGGCFGVLGYLVAGGARTIGAPFDPIAAAVVISALCHRAVFGFSIVGSPTSGWLSVDTDPVAPGDGEPSDTAGGTTATPDAETDGSRPAVEIWLPHQYQWRDVTILGVVTGALAGYLAHLTASPFLAFGVSAAALAFMVAGVPKIPVTHHMTLPASTAVLAVAGVTVPASPVAVASTVTPGTAVLVGAVFGGLGGISGEVAARVFYDHAETHLDPPAASIVVSTALIALLAAVGVLPGAAWIPVPF
jgi:hypothetical protein